MFISIHMSLFFFILHYYTQHIFLIFRSTICFLYLHYYYNSTQYFIPLVLYNAIILFVHIFQNIITICTFFSFKFHYYFLNIIFYYSTTFNPCPHRHKERVTVVCLSFGLNISGRLYKNIEMAAYQQT